MATKRRQTTTRAAVKRWMKDDVGAHVDNRTGEVNCTSLAECAAAQFHLYDDGPEYPIPEWVFDIAAEVGEARERAEEVRDGR